MARRQHYLFAHKKLPQLFHQDPQRFFVHLRDDEQLIDLLRFWEEIVEDFDLDDQDIVDPLGLELSYREAQDYGLVIISLPLPQTSPEVYFIGIWAKFSSNYSSNYSGNYSDNYFDNDEGAPFRYFMLELEDEVVAEELNSVHSGTLLCEWTADGEHRHYGYVAEPTVNGFIQAIETLVAQQNRLETGVLESPLKVARPMHVNDRPGQHPQSSATAPHNDAVKEMQKLLNPHREQGSSSITGVITREQIQEIMAKRQAQRQIQKQFQGQSHGQDMPHEDRNPAVNVSRLEMKNSGNNNALQVFEGTFKPPVIGFKSTPIKIAGSGWCELTADALKVRGFQQISQVNGVLIVILCLVIFIISRFIGGLFRAVLLGLITVFLYSSSQGKGTDHNGKSVDLFVPWKNILDVKLDQGSGMIIIRIKNFRLQEKYHKSGALFFQPSTSPSMLIDALNVRRY